MKSIAYFNRCLLFGIFSLFIGCELLEDTEDEPNPTNNSVELTASKNGTDSQGNQYEVGFRQASGNNQNPYVRKTDASGNELWQINHETTGVDGRANLIIIDQNDVPFVVFSVDGGSNSNDYINKKAIENGAFQNVFQNSYGSGGGPKVSILAQLNPENGKIVKATFLTARLNSGRTNTLNITKIGKQDDMVLFEVSSAAFPFGAGKSYSKYPDITDADRVDGAFKVYYEIKADMSEIMKAELLNE